MNFPGEQAGKLAPHEKDPFAVATLGIGYGISINALQLAHAYATLANHGVKMPLSLLRVNQPPQGEPVMDAKNADQILKLMEAVVAGKGGTGELARIPGYQVAGKTGTSRIAGAHGYQARRYVSSFVGIAPASRPRLVVAVIIRDPKGKVYYGGAVSGPVFEKIMEGALAV